MINSILRIAFLLLALETLPGGSPSLAAQELRVRFLDVGQGDASLITTPEGRHVLIDAGPGAKTVLELLDAEGIDTLDLVIASHAHADHIGGMVAILENKVVRYYVDNGLPYTTGTYRRTLNELTGSGVQYLTADSRTITVGSVGFRLMPPLENQDPKRQNEASTGVVVQYGGFKALYTGDSEWGELDWWLKADSVPQVSVVKVSHHGSANGTTRAWTEATRPALAVISVGAKNRYRHPSPIALRLWASAGATIARTDLHGTVDVRADSTGRFVVMTRVGRWSSDSLPRTGT